MPICVLPQALNGLVQWQKYSLHHYSAVYKEYSDCFIYTKPYQITIYLYLRNEWMLFHL